MKMMKILPLFAVVMLGLSGCAEDRSPLQARVENAAPRRDADKIRDNTDTIPDSDVGHDALIVPPPEAARTPDPDPGDDLGRAVSREQARAARMAEAVCTVPEIARAAAVITGNTAIIGIETAAEAEDSHLVALKTSVEKAALEADSEITHTAVTASEELFARIAAMTDGAVYPPVE